MSVHAASSPVQGLTVGSVRDSVMEVMHLSANSPSVQACTSGLLFQECARESMEEMAGRRAPWTRKRVLQQEGKTRGHGMF